ncbi:MAG: hypothetical protein ACT4NL_07915 [Pseudomarimonas sp.]
MGRFDCANAAGQGPLYSIRLIGLLEINDTDPTDPTDPLTPPILDLPVYLDADVREYLAERAKAKGIELGRLVNDLLKREIDLIEAVK